MKSEDYLAIFSLSSVLKMTVPHLITRIMFVPTQMGRAMIPIAIETANLSGSGISDYSNSTPCPNHPSI